MRIDNLLGERSDSRERSVMREPTDGFDFDAGATSDIPALIQTLLTRLRAATRDIPAARSDEILEVSELLAVTALHAHAADQDSRQALHSAARPYEVDALTGLPNRALFRDRFSQALAHARRRNSRVALLFVDLDHFKEVNDSLGHAAGDMIIRHVAQSLKEAGRDVDTVCRHGGDEFLILLSEIGDPSSAARFAEKVAASLSEPVRVGGTTLAVGASIGISVYPDDGEDQDILIQRADAAMYVAKRNGIGFAFASTHTDATPRSTRTVSGEAHDPIGLLEVALAEANTSITDLKAANARLELDLLNAEREQGKANQAKQYQSQLLNVVAHELRNSLSPLQSAAEVLSLVRSDMSLMPRLELVLKRQIGHITTMLTDLLDVSRLNTGRMTMELERVDLAAILQTSAEQMAASFAKRNQNVWVLIETPSPFLVGDSGRLSQLVCSLLDRVSVTAAHGAEITASLYDRDGAMVFSAAEGRDGAAGHDAAAERLDVSDTSQSSDGSNMMSVSVLVVIELLKSHGGELTIARAPTGDSVRFQCLLPLAH